MDQFGPLRCPACDYDLQGLPVPHRCPECGTQYDICRTHWRPTPAAIDSHGLFLKLAIYCLIAIGLSIFLPGAPFGLGIAGGIGLSLIAAWFAYRIRREYVQFDSTGVIVRSVQGESRIPWHRVSHAQRQSVNWELRLVHPTESVSLPPILTRKDSEREFHQALAAARNRWWKQRETRLPPIAGDSRRELIGPLTEFEKCPLCNGDIRGLPAVYACPGCGFAYDEATRLWKPKHYWPHILVAMITLGVVSIPTLMFVKFLTGEAIPRNFASLPALALAVLFSAAVAMSVRVTRGRYVAIKSDGVHARTAFGPRFVPWTDIASATQRDKTVILFSHRNCELLRLSGVFADEAAAEQFRQAICPDS